ncbi:hypothetical protein [Bradyrhizobium sp. CW10]|uniref:hypothetical protein n=1 Tax=Bradyrhizobium sp. CW10 TaxID=2782683 RepID=UPI001FF9AA33|nr:hypothetical protein [Bradyrhizobium sp. CW10]MCK1469870.1 transposase [Bradyrhizobium sp. CW10]
MKAFKSPERPKRLDGLEGWLRERFIRSRQGGCGGPGPIGRKMHGSQSANAATRRAALRQVLRAEALATSRFETPPGRQLQIDFGERLVEIGEVKIKAFVFVATLGHSRRLHVRAFRGEKQEHWSLGSRVHLQTAACRRKC